MFEAGWTKCPNPEFQRGVGNGIQMDCPDGTSAIEAQWGTALALYSTSITMVRRYRVKAMFLCLGYNMFTLITLKKQGKVA